MKKYLVSLILLGIIITGGLTANASEVTTSEIITTTTESEAIDNTTDVTIEVGPGIGPNNPLYFLDKGFEDLQLWLTRNDSKKAELLLKIAEERLSELNKLPEDKVSKYVDKLVDEYSDKVNQANEKINTLMMNNKLSENAKLKLHERLNHTVDVENVLKDDVSSKISDEVRVKINEIKSTTYLTAIASGLTHEEITALKEQGYGYGEILKLNALAKVTGKTIEELKLLDIYDDLGEIDFSKVATELGMTEDAVMDQIKDYRDTVKDDIQSQVREKVQEKKDEIKKQVEERQEEIKKRIEEKINSRLDERRNEVTELINTNIDLHLLILDSLLEQGFITNEDKQLILDHVSEMKDEILSQIEDNTLNRNDYEQMRLEVTQFIQTKLNEELETIDLTQVDLSQLSTEAIEILNYLLGNPEEIINNTIDRLLLTLEERNISLTEAQIQSIKTRINEGISNGDFDTDSYDDMLKQITEVIREEMGRDYPDIFDNINQFKERYQDRIQEDKDDDEEDEVDVDQQLIALFNHTVTELNVEAWNLLSNESQNDIRDVILSNLNIGLSNDEIVAIIQIQLAEMLEQNEVNEELIDLFNDTIADLDLVLWNYLPKLKQDQIRGDILSKVDFNLTEDEMINQIIELIHEELNLRGQGQPN